MVKVNPVTPRSWKKFLKDSISNNDNYDDCKKEVLEALVTALLLKQIDFKVVSAGFQSKGLLILEEAQNIAAGVREKYPNL